jgi:hypothetical protein
VTQTRTCEMPTTVDVDGYHTPYYAPTMMHVEEEKNLASKVDQLEEDVERMESNTFRGMGCNKKNKP